MTISQELFDVMCCPVCKGDLTLSKSPEGLICPACRLFYPIRDDIPIMLPDEATPFDPDKQK